ncbi:hypothetical protein [Spirosoma jeollabukense]
MKLLEKVKQLFSDIRLLRYENKEMKLLIGTLLSQNIRTAKSFKEAEFKVFSQFGDDGIIQYLVNKLNITAEKFVEFGVENYEESNTRFLLQHNNWQGLIIDGSIDHINYIKNDPIYWLHDLTAVNSFITTANINQILSENGFNEKLGILSIDIDGNDYWVWQAITDADADIVIVEYNSTFGFERAISIPYKSDFSRLKAHYSGLYFGASLCALCDVGNKKGYAFVGCNQAGNNAYFVKNYLLGELKALSPREGYVKAKFRESRDQNGKLTFLTEKERLKTITGLPVVNTQTGILETI